MTVDVINKRPKLREAMRINLVSIVFEKMAVL